MEPSLHRSSSMVRPLRFGGGPASASAGGRAVSVVAPPAWRAEEGQHNLQPVPSSGAALSRPSAVRGRGRRRAPRSVAGGSSCSLGGRSAWPCGVSGVRRRAGGVHTTSGVAAAGPAPHPRLPAAINGPIQLALPSSRPAAPNHGCAWGVYSRRRAKARCGRSVSVEAGVVEAVMRRRRRRPARRHSASWRLTSLAREASVRR